MKHVFKVGEIVFARVAGFEPFPATVESVHLNESESSVFYYVRFHGGTQIAPIDANNLLSFNDNKKLFKFKYGTHELKNEAKLRIDAIMGAEDDIPEVLMNFVTVDSDFEEVSNETVKRLGLYSITLTTHMVKTLDDTLSRKHSKCSIESASESEDEFVEVVDLPQVSGRAKIQSRNQLTCLNCNVKWATSRGLEAHLRQTKCGAARDAVLKGNQEENRNKDQMMRKMWASRSASGYFNCKLCYRKFRSKGEAQAHMSSKHRGLMKNVKIKVDDSADASFSDSDSISQNRSADKHSSMERERRRALAKNFETLSEALLLDPGCSKVKILSTAQQEITKLEQEYEDTKLQIDKLTSLNGELKARYLELNKKKKS